MLSLVYSFYAFELLSPYLHDMGSVKQKGFTTAGKFNFTWKTKVKLQKANPFVCNSYSSVLNIGGTITVTATEISRRVLINIF